MDDLIAKYKKKYGEEWGNRNNYPRELIEKMRVWVAAKDLDKLRPVIYTENGFSREVFERLADKRLGTTQKLRWAQLRAWAGEEVCAAYDRAELQRLEEREAKRTASQLESFADLMKFQETQYKGQNMSRYDFMKAVIKDGHIRLSVNTGGAVPIYELHNPADRSFYQFRRKLEYDLLASLLSDEEKS